MNQLIEGRERLRTAVINTQIGKRYLHASDTEYLHVEFISDNVSVKRTIYIYDGIPILINLFKILKDNWMGFVGTRHFESVEEDFELITKHNGLSNIGFRIFIGEKDGAGEYFRTEIQTSLELRLLDEAYREIQKLGMPEDKDP
ncbi:MAG: hypothetical protein EOP48_20475 [Sphingobacteriales bacterium]|nr:MAG: hypothetical protein EOP48_20475 [Sphingobacteriales bacterium]